MSTCLHHSPALQGMGGNNMGSSPQAEKDGLRLSEIIESIGSQSSRTRVQPCSTQEKPTLKEDDDEIDPDIRELGDSRTSTQEQFFMLRVCFGA